MNAKYHSNRGEKSALLLVSEKFKFSYKPVYVPRKDVEEYEIGDDFEIPSMDTQDWVDPETGEVRTTEDGIPLQVFV